MVRPDDSALLEVRKCVPGHPLHGNGLDLHSFERAHERAVGLGSVGGNTQAKCFEYFEMLEVRENIDISSSRGHPP